MEIKVLDYGAERKWQGLSALSVPLLPKPQSRLARRPALQVNVNTSKLHGFLVITHNSDDTGYKILLQDKGHSVPVKTVDNVIVRKLAATLVELIDDGTKRVEIPSQGLATNAVIAGDYLLSS